jgi:hypothetical protein
MENSPGLPGRTRKERVRDVTAHVARLSLEELQSYLDEVKGFVDGLKTKYPDALNRKPLHELIGSTANASAIPDDFPGEDSVEGFITYLEQKYIK